MIMIEAIEYLISKIDKFFKSDLSFIDTIEDAFQSTLDSRYPEVCRLRFEVIQERTKEDPSSSASSSSSSSSLPEQTSRLTIGNGQLIGKIQLKFHKLDEVLKSKGHIPLIDKEKNMLFFVREMLLLVRGEGKEGLKEQKEYQSGNRKEYSETKDYKLCRDATFITKQAYMQILKLDEDEKAKSSTYTAIKDSVLGPSVSEVRKILKACQDTLPGFEAFCIEADKKRNVFHGARKSMIDLDAKSRAQGGMVDLFNVFIAKYVIRNLYKAHIGISSPPISQQKRSVLLENIQKLDYENSHDPQQSYKVLLDSIDSLVEKGAPVLAWNYQRFNIMCRQLHGVAETYIAMSGHKVKGHSKCQF